MKDALQTIGSVADLRGQVLAWRQDNRSVALVPTMGALHEGHLSLVRLAKDRAEKVVVSIFVNPTQFAAGEDFESYPHKETEDLKTLTDMGVDAAFVPTASEIYPQGFATSVQVRGLTDILCGAHRQGHFDGVALVVTKLLLMCLPDVALFGEKDYQQLLIIRRFVEDLNIPVEILSGPIVREPDGLALSSRNQYLSKEERAIASHLPAALKATSAAIAAGSPITPLLDQAKESLLAAGFDSIDYLEVRACEDLSLMDTIERPARLFVAAQLGKTRLIDNWPLG